ncbi:MAG: selenide, water dikinase SelD [Azonexus sp.]|nr:selenide, water dikinase SelD [Azonexus sp.]MDZ4315449.1 selenide, water dikinase SelD [Azonexus sp.]
MQATASPVLRDIVLIGGGHSHVGVLHRFAMNPLPGVRLTVICTDTETPYSGMLPGYIAGHYRFDEVHIDLRRLAEFAGARYYRDEVIGIDRASRQVLCRQRPPVVYDVLSINIGSTPQLAQVAGACEHAVPVKPIRRFNERWLALLARVCQHPGATTIAVVGAGAGGVELTLAMQYRLRHELLARGRHPDELRFHLFSASSQILPTHNARVRRAFASVLLERGVIVHLDAKVTQLSAGSLQTEAGEVLAADEIIWVTQAGGAAWLRETGLALDDKGFIRIHATLQSETDPLIFAAGDCAAMIDHPLEKAGVFAVRMAKPLAENLRRTLLRQPLLSYRPQQSWLALVSTGDPHAIASRGSFYARGDLLWRWKDWIDRRFMRKFTELNPLPMAGPRLLEEIPLDEDERIQAISVSAMRCGGCGAKVGASVLARALARIQPLERNDVLIGLQAPDDAAVVRVPSGKAIVQTVDFFRAFIDDPWLLGQIAANHALGDIFAMGAEAQTATAIATVPPGLASKVEDTVFQMLAGAVSVLNEAGCALVGGHTGEGQELGLGFAINGLVDETLANVMRKSGMRPGDVLLLTKPIGTGTLLAAHARLQVAGRWIDAALDSMLVSNRPAIPCLIAHGATACTDLTGFGLFGHLLEMCRASGVDVELALAAVPVLDAAVDTISAGIFSSLQPANIRLSRALQQPDALRKDPRYPLLFDPQTAGGLLVSIPAESADACLAALHGLGYLKAARIGRVLASVDGREPIRLLA